MSKITEKLLLERGSPKCAKLEQVRRLNLSGLDLRSADLPLPLLSRLRSLEKLDLSRNRLQELPAGLQLPRLCSLDCSDNEMEDVLSLQSLTALEELRLEGNLYLTVSDNYKLMFLLPKLRMFNGKDVASSASHLRHVNSANLRKRVEALWESSFRPPEPPTAERLQALEKEFVKAARSQIKYGPSSLSDYTTWRLEGIAKELLQTLAQGDKEEGTEKKQAEPDAVKDNTGAGPRTPAKRKGAASSPSEGALKKQRQADDAPPKASPQKPSRLQTEPGRPKRTMESPGKESVSGSPRKSLRTANCQKPSALSRHPGTPTKAPTNPQPAESEKRTPRKSTNPKKPVCLEPLHVLQCHSKQDSPEDFSTQLWACAFEPSVDSGESGQRTSRTVATCGGESVCLIDCETGRVLKKYKVPGEEFFCLAWSSVPMSRAGGGVRPCGVLAVGGRRGVVKLIHARANCAYGEFRASRRALSALRFCPHRGSFLFTGAYDNRIVLWDIGGVDSDYNFKVSQLLTLDANTIPLHLNMPPSSPERHLLAACDKGLHCFDIQLSKSQLKRSSEFEILFPVYAKEDKENNYRTIDGMAFLSDDVIVSKSHMQGSIYVWSWSKTLASRSGRSRKEARAVLLAELQWSGTDLPYLSLSTCPGEGYVVCGDEKGGLWTYHLEDQLESRAKAGKLLSPTQVLEWPAPVRKDHGPVRGPSVNSVALDPKLRYLVALTDKNMAVIWKRV
ncbi:leucine-rich repeat and WD repeat-containing protein 1 [Lepisosteus oculatus]|uniref:leucine-rich repeat and WD repeat-containing protein 1 n=1 Tax=Lepisosteus oculatus TaxID=7918 RepID=UPI00371530DD